MHLPRLCLLYRDILGMSGGNSTESSPRSGGFQYIKKRAHRHRPLITPASSRTSRILNSSRTLLSHMTNATCCGQAAETHAHVRMYAHTLLIRNTPCRSSSGMGWPPDDRHRQSEGPPPWSLAQILLAAGQHSDNRSTSCTAREPTLSRQPGIVDEEPRLGLGRHRLSIAASPEHESRLCLCGATCLARLGSEDKVG